MPLRLRLRVSFPSSMAVVQNPPKTRLPVEPALHEIRPRQSGNVETVWSDAYGQRRRIVVAATAYHSAGLAKVHRRLKAERE